MFALDVRLFTLGTVKALIFMPKIDMIRGKEMADLAGDSRLARGWFFRGYREHSLF